MACHYFYKYKDYLTAFVLLVFVFSILFYVRHNSVKQDQGISINEVVIDPSKILPNIGETTQAEVDQILNSHPENNEFCYFKAKSMLEEDLKNEDPKVATAVINNSDELMNRLSINYIGCKKIKQMGGEFLK